MTESANKQQNIAPAKAGEETTAKAPTTAPPAKELPEKELEKVSAGLPRIVR